MNNEEILEMNDKKKFDICLMNPPYDNGLHEKFLEKIIDLSDIICTIQPTSFIVGKKQKDKIIKKIDNCYVNIEKINGNQVFKDVSYLNGEVGILIIDKFKDKKILYNNVVINDIREVKRFSDDHLISKFNNIIKKILNDINDNVQNHIIYNWKLSNDEKKKYFDKWIIRISAIVREFKIFSKDTKIGLYQDLNKLKTNKQSSPGEIDYLKMFLSFDNKSEMNNCFNYLHTDFVNTCMYLIKTGMHTDRGELKYIPWFDFSDDHFSKSPKEIDDWLFKKYDISNEIRKHIEEILPDYYNIRK